MLAVRTPGAPQTARVSAVFSSAFPITGEGQLLRSRSISGLFSRSLHSGLQPPCLRFAMAVTGHHARLGTRLLARLYRGRYLKRRSSTRFQGATLIELDVPISGIQLSDWLHRKAHGEEAWPQACSAADFPFAFRHSSLGRVRSLMVFSGLSPITSTSPSSKAHQKAGSFAPPALPNI